MPTASCSVPAAARLCLRPRSTLLSSLEGMLARTAPRLDRLDPPPPPREEPRPAALPRLSGGLPRADR